MNPATERQMAEERRILQTKFNWLSQLSSFPPFFQFLDHIRELHDDQEKIALDSSKTDDECRVARHLRKVLKEEVLDYVENERNLLEQKLKS